MTLAAFDPLRTLTVLKAHRVRFIVIGAFAGRLWGSPSVTNDLDICYAWDPANLTALASALRELRASLRGVSDAIPFRLDAQSLKAGDHFTFATDAGNFDCLGFPAGSGGFAQLARAAEDLDLGRVKAWVASLEDLIRMKRASGRPKDLIEVEVFCALRDEIEEQGDGPHSR